MNILEVDQHTLEYFFQSKFEYWAEFAKNASYDELWDKIAFFEHLLQTNPWAGWLEETLFNGVIEILAKEFHLREAEIFPLKPQDRYERLIEDE